MDTLIAGNIQYWTEANLRTAFPEDSLVICGLDCEEKKRGNMKWFQIGLKKRKLQRIFDTYTFERVIYVSEYLTYHTIAENEMENLRRLLRLCRNSSVKQFIYFTSDAICATEENSKKMILESAEDLCRYYASQARIELKIVRSPFLLSGTVEKDYLYDLFHRTTMGNDEIILDAPKEETNHFVDMRDVADFFYRLQDRWDEEDEVLRLFPAGGSTFEVLGEFLKSKKKELRVSYGSDATARPVFSDEENLVRKKYGWVPMYDPFHELEEYYQQYKSLHEEKPTLKDVIREKFNLKSRTMMIVELLLGALFFEILVRSAGNSVQFRMIDYRLVYVVLIATVYGTNMGFAAAVIETISLIWAYYAQGSNWVLLFYDPGNWLPFILLFVTAAVCGYVKQKKDEDIRFVEKENAQLKEQQNFVTQLYEEAIDYKNQYKQDLIGSRDGFGRIFEVVRRLSNTVPEKIFAESIPVMEDVLNNDSIAIYTINDQYARFARLEVSSNQVASRLRKSIQLDDYQHILAELKKGEVWFNREMDENYPVYMAGIQADGVLSVLIMIYHVEYGQANNYYTNLIRILSGLMENFIVKAWEYRRAIEARIYYPGTIVARDEYFRNQLSIQQEMAENHHTSFRLFRIDPAGKTVEEMDALLQSKVRNNDLIGLGKDGSIYVLAAQVDENSEEIVLKRFLSMGLHCEIVEQMGAE